MKRVVDLVLAIPVAAIAMPLVFALALVIRLESRGPALFSQVRIGRHGKPFVCRKLRTMRDGTPSAPTHQVGAGAVTASGRVLRATKLDELPQLWNVIRGEMSLVGPRPCLPVQEELIGHRQRLGVLAMRPGMTGLAQVRGIDMSDPQRCAATDAEYRASQSLGLDFAIMARTLFGRR
ncbi:MAG: sugar transferase [Hyphomicrobiales bacterium]|nr:sugar transferase [Hyphomicrobiales bacterium]